MKILIVDDSDVNRRILARMVRAVDGTADCVANGQQALDYLRDATPDLIFMDLGMPVMDGFETVRRLRAVHDARTLPI